MAPDLLSTICREIDERLNELRPLLAERERLLVAADALLAAEFQDTAVVAKEPTAKGSRRDGHTRGGRRGSAAGATKRATTDPSEVEPEQEAGKGSGTPPEAAEVGPTNASLRAAAKPERATRGAAREAILGALKHGSHTVGELVVVTAMSGPNINGNLRRLAAEGVVVKAEREGKAAWALTDPVI